jgi:hypothetical protein
MNNKLQRLNPPWDKLGVGPAPDRYDSEVRQAWDDFVSMAPARSDD